jgi:prevent-host-death family protein
MAEVTVRDLRNRGADVLERVIRGETLTVTRDGRPVAELRPMRRRALRAAALLQRWRRLPRVEPERLRRDIDAIIDTTL